MRIIGITHRVKRTADGEARPTIIAIKDGNDIKRYELETETDELDFLLGKFPTSWRKAEEGEDLSGFIAHHIKEGKSGTKVPATYDGYKSGDVVVMPLGGSGDAFAFALSRRGEEIDAHVHRLPSYILKDKRGDGDKDGDAELLITLFFESPALFYGVTPRERDIILVREQWRARDSAQYARKACEQRLRQRAIGRIFLSDEGRYPEGTIEDAYEAIKANDRVLQNLYVAEKDEEKLLAEYVSRIPVYTVLSEVEGCGPILAARLIAAIGDINRFASDAKLKAYCGVHVKRGGKHDGVLKEKEFPRQRTGERCNWNGEARQALYLLVDQFVKRPDSVWGKKLREYKEKFRAIHPEEVVNGKKRYGKGHIHKMAIWRTATKFTEWLYSEWRRLEKAQSAPMQDRKAA